MSQLPFPPAEQVLLWSCRHLHPGGRHGSVNLKHVMHIHIESISKIWPNRAYSLLAKRYAYVPFFLEFFVHTDIPAVGLDVFHLLLYLQVFPSQDIQMKIFTATVAANPHELRGMCWTSRRGLAGWTSRTWQKIPELLMEGTMRLC